MKNKKFFLISLIYFTALLCTVSVFILGYLGIVQNDILSTFLIQIVAMFSVPLIMYTLLCSKNIKSTFNDCGFNKISGKMIGLTIALGFVLYFINTFVAEAFSSFIALTGYESLYSSVPVNLNYELLFKEFLLSCILPGFCEEFLHRGILLFAGKKYGNTKFCLIISSLLFGLTHLNINQFFYAAILGFLMGCVALSANSIIPTIIIHFMNNFLSNYFFYGKYLNFPLAMFVDAIESIITQNPIYFAIFTTFTVVALFMLYIYLLKRMKLEKTKYEVHKIVEQLKLQQLPIEEAKQKINEANKILNNDNKETQQNALTFTDKMFLYSSIVLGVMITISTYIWGIL